MRSFRVRRGAADDGDAIRHVNRAAFDRDDEADLVDALQDGGYVVALVVVAAGAEDGSVCGCALFSEVMVEDAAEDVRAVALAPVAVLPDFQGNGAGSAVISFGLELCRNAGYGLALVPGSPAYYRRFGFSVELARSLESEYAGEHFMALRLSADTSASGTLRYPPPFGEV